MNTLQIIKELNWDDLVSKTYGRPYSFQQQDKCKDRGLFEFTVPNEPCDYKNDSIVEKVNGPKMGVSFKAWLARDPKSPPKDDEKEYSSQDWMIDLFWSRNFYPDFQMVANDLCEKGLIEPGEYAINIDW